MTNLKINEKNEINNAMSNTFLNFVVPKNVFIKLTSYNTQLNNVQETILFMKSKSPGSIFKKPKISKTTNEARKSISVLNNVFSRNLLNGCFTNDIAFSMCSGSYPSSISLVSNSFEGF